MSEELEDKYLAVLQKSFKERLELRKENKKLKEELANRMFTKETVSLGSDHKYFPIFFSSKNYTKLLVIQSEPVQKYWLKDKEIELEKLIDILEGIKVNENTKSEPESDKYYIIDLDSCKYLVEDSNGYTLDKDKATIFSYKDALSIVSLSNKNFITQRVNLESNILDEDKKKVLLDYIDKKIAYYSESDLKSISECMFHRSFEKELQKIRALLLYDNSSPWLDYHFS